MITSVFNAADDLALPFQLERPALRGRVVRLGHTVDTVLTRHAYPEPVSRQLGELLTLAAMLSGALKYAGIFSLQVRSDGPVSLMVADMTHDGRVRGYARFDPDGVAALGADASAEQLLGKGVLALTVEMADQKDPYQGIVELRPLGLTDSMLGYFRNSEQIRTALTVEVGRLETGSGSSWRAGGVMLQRLPEEERHTEDGPVEDWRRAMLLLNTVTPAELLDPDLPAERLVARLFLEEEPRVYPPDDLTFGCRCSEEKVLNMLAGFPKEERIAMADEEGAIEVTCQFCSTLYHLDRDALSGLSDA
ncbi:Hsp33 family molecular chaperone HslO [Marinivivus vitaminiproducens]|uniref:Hsp33 family molecular chaperone HslO n=1 Tax=Marinivivus vitaminiproducens TaxID=3035935 RepID=UPI0027A74BE9|nr:Hsp33 family molecular chaperone HslO [Geminicoccaceae bacterium SCSIO 64248]